MRTIKIPELEYEIFEQVRDILYSHIPTMIISATYSKKQKMGYFQILDGDFIPPTLRKFVIAEISHSANRIIMESLNVGLKIIFKESVFNEQENKE